MGVFVPELVVLNYIFRHVRNSQSHDLKPGHGGIQVEILDVHCHEFCIGCADAAVEEELESEYVGGGRLVFILAGPLFYATVTFQNSTSVQK